MFHSRLGPRRGLPSGRYLLTITTGTGHTVLHRTVMVVARP